MMEKALNQAGGILFFFGILVASSDGPYFPYINIFGALACWAMTFALLYQAARRRGGLSNGQGSSAPGSPRREKYREGVSLS